MGLRSEEILLEMKNLSELMVDLAYSALLYNNREIAEEVNHLEDRVDELHESLLMQTLREVEERGCVEKALIMLRISRSIEVIADSAKTIADVVLRDVEPHEVIRESIRESEITITLGRVTPTSILANRTLGDLNLASETGMWVIAIKRGRRWIFGPNENTLIRPGDLLIAKGPLEGVRHFKRLCSSADREL